MPRFTLLFTLALLLGACATPSPREREASRLEQIERHAGAPVDDFRLWQLQRWERLGPYKLLVWTRINEAWLLTVQKPCSGFEFANAITLTSTLNRVHRRFDALKFEHQTCRIDEIRPVDGKALKREGRSPDSD
jgi:hypothetical protein